MTGPRGSWRLSTALVLAALALAMYSDLRYFRDTPWILALYTLPVLLAVRLPVTGVLGLCTLTILAAIGSAVSFEALAWSPERIVSVVEVGLLAALVVYVRASRDALERNNERVAGILDGSDTGFVRMDSRLRIRDANGPWLRMVRAGRTGEVLGTRLPEWFPTERRRAAEAMLAFLDEGDRRSFETELAPLRGASIHVVVTAYAERVGDAVTISAVFADVSAIRRAEAEARTSEQQLRSHLERTPLAAVVLDDAQRVREWNAAAERIFGRPRAEALGMDAWTLVPPEQRASRVAPFGDPTASRGGYERSEQLTRDGRRVLLQWYHTPLPEADGEVRRVASLGLDVTQQEAMEQALRVSETKFATVFQQSPDALLLVRLRDNALLDTNETVERMLGWTREELHARWAHFEQFWESPDDLERFSALVRAKDEVEAFETHMLERDGNALSVLLSARRLRVEDSAALLLTIRDLTAIREAETRRRELEQQLEQAQRLEGIGRLAGGIAHDFNNMLAGVQGYAELIEVQAGQREQVEHYASRILDTTRRAAELVAKLLTFSRQGARRRRYFDIHAVVLDTLDLLGQTLGPGVRVEPRLEAPRLAVHGDESQISNALLNLCVNARDALGEGGTITVSSERVALDEVAARQVDPQLAAGDFVVLRVIDDGCGIPEENLEHIFVPFFTTKEEGRGTGLGLPSVYGAAKGNGGAVTVESAVGVGTTFSIWLPAWPASSIPDAQRSKVAAIDLGGRSVLVVDDEMSMRDTLARSLQSLGCSVRVAADGREAIMRFEERVAEWDLVLLDVGLPELSGEDVYRAVAARRPDLPVILMSGYDRTARMQQLRGEGAAGVLGKPFSREDLLAELSRVLTATDTAPLRIVRKE
ncbi:MAG: PAS domain S-box protein [Pseudomonadales bacterium]|jgi:PAS domain S-box-containing protein|nr:PAS domain S-box protein [Pseudomonadales bacterium]